VSAEVDSVCVRMEVDNACVEVDSVFVFVCGSG